MVFQSATQILRFLVDIAVQLKYNTDYKEYQTSALEL